MSQSNSSEYHLAIIFLSIILAAAFFFFSFAAVDTFNAISNILRERSFVPTNAEISKCFIVEELSGGKDKSQAKNQHITGYYPRIIVQYRVNGKEYTADSKVYLVKDGSSFEDAMQYLQKIAPGQHITYQQYQTEYLSSEHVNTLKNYITTTTNLKNKIEIFYNPKKPEEVNISLDKSMDWFGIIMSLLLIIPSIIVFRISFARIGSPGLFWPVTIGIFLIIFYLTSFLNSKTKQNRCLLGKPYVSIGLDENFTPKNFMKYIDPEDRDDWKEDSTVQN